MPNRGVLCGNHAFAIAENAKAEAASNPKAKRAPRAAGKAKAKAKKSARRGA